MDMNTLDAQQILEMLDLERVPIALFLIAAGWFGMAVLGRLLDDLGERFTDRRLMLKKAKALIRFSLYLVLGVVVPLSILKSSGREALVPVLATLGLGLGFAFKDLVASLVSGVLILFDEPFQVGDRISFAGYYGEVTEIGLRSVRLVTLDDNLVTIPNSKFLTDPVASANAGALDCMVVVPFFLAPAEDLGRARRVLEEVTATSRFVYLDKPVVTVVSEEFRGERFVAIVSVKAYVFDARYEKAFLTDLTVRGKQALRAAGIQMPDQAYRDLEIFHHEAPASSKA